MKLTLIAITALISTVIATPKADLICCKFAGSECDLRRDVSILTPKGYLNERSGALSANPEGICCCWAEARADCGGCDPPPL